MAIDARGARRGGVLVDTEEPPANRHAGEDLHPTGGPPPRRPVGGLCFSRGWLSAPASRCRRSASFSPPRLSACSSLARPAPAPVGLGWLGSLPLAALVVGGRHGRRRSPGPSRTLPYWTGRTPRTSPRCTRTTASSMRTLRRRPAPRSWGRSPCCRRRGCPSRSGVRRRSCSGRSTSVGYVPVAMVPIYLTGDLEPVLSFQVALVSSMAILGLIVRVRPPAIRVPTSR